MANTGYIGIGPADRDPTVSDDSVTTAKIQNAAVTALKLDTTGTASSSTFLRGDFSWQANAGGDVAGPASSTDNALARYDSTTGKIIQNSTATLSDAGALTASSFVGDVTGNVSGTAATVTGATQSNITALGTIASLVATTADINGGTFDGIVGGTTPAAGSFTSITATLDIDLVPDKSFQWSANEKITCLSGSSPANDIAIYSGGAERVRFAVGGGIGLAGANYGTSGQAMLSGGTAANPSWGTIPSLSAASEWTAQQNFNNTALTFDATQDWALAANQVATLTLTANTIFDAPTQMVDGAFYSLIIIQDGTGGWTTSWNGVFKWAAGTAPTLTTTAAAKDILVWRSDGVNMYEVGRQLNVS